MQSKITHSRGSVAGVIGALVVGLVMMFVGLFMVNAVYNATNLPASSAFAGIQTNTITLAGTLFSVLGLVLIIVALATAIGSLRGVTGGG